MSVKNREENFYQEVSPEEAKEHFSNKMLDVFFADIESQILEHQQLKEYGRGLFLFTDASISNETKVNVAVNVAWQLHVEDKRVLKLVPVKFHLYSGDLPDEILDKMNEITKLSEDNPQGIIEFKEYDSTNNKMTNKRI